MKLQGKVALITGGGTGIGAAIAKRFVGEGAKVCIAGRRKELLDQVASSLPAESVAICPGDVSCYQDVERMVETTLKLGRRLNVLVNNAGMDQTPPANVIDIDPEIWQKVISVNLTGSNCAIAHTATYKAIVSQSREKGKAHYGMLQLQYPMQEVRKIRS